MIPGPRRGDLVPAGDEVPGGRAPGPGAEPGAASCPSPAPPERPDGSRTLLPGKSLRRVARGRPAAGLR